MTLPQALHVAVEKLPEHTAAFVEYSASTFAIVETRLTKEDHLWEPQGSSYTCCQHGNVKFQEGGVTVV